MKKFLLLTAIAAVLAGCAVYTPGGAIVIDPPGGGGHCPPGQAKKGNC
jgi:hypothetical protein